MALANIEFIQYMHQLLETQVIDCYVITCTNILLMLVFDISVFCKQMLTLIRRLNKTFPQYPIAKTEDNDENEGFYIQIKLQTRLEFDIFDKKIGYN